MDTNAWVNAMGAALLQEYNDGLHPVAYHSCKYHPAEHNYSAGDKELLAIVQACSKWRCYLEGLPSLIYTNHEPHQTLHTKPFLSRRWARWLERMNELPIKIVYRSGPFNIVVDTLLYKPQRE